ncbi:SDR family NAD(P)-dependent oxidoreductase [Nocardia suismassiliense]|uniref:SDR family NAD(P)-dependent oxidoreductase n=1 Tax=Nocardia suismassiliense TaxID=2077092 RepID=UPI000D1DB901|nr:SDR family NAD(P)-dependent oxidoreductase [Nocardia suismassiliense]
MSSATAGPPLDPAANRLDGKIALVTGTGGGQGRAAARLFAAAGAQVIGCDLNAENAEETVRIVAADGYRMTSCHPCDLADPSAVATLIASSVETHGGLDVLYNNAGSATFGPVGAIPLSDWRHTILNELEIVFTLTQAAWPHLRARGRTSIINTSSVAAHRGFGHLAGLSHVAAKGGVVAMTRQLAVEGAPHGIRVNSVSPGPVVTPASQEQLGDTEHARYVLDTLLSNRLGSPADVAQVALFLASDASAWVTGSDFVVDGGRMAWA